jgi:phosphate transport system permease protein
MGPSARYLRRSAAIYGTIISSMCLIIATPLALGVAVFLSEFAPSWLRQPVAFFVDLLAAIQAATDCGIFVLQPLLRDHVMPFLSACL